MSIMFEHFHAVLWTGPNFQTEHHDQLLFVLLPFAAALLYLAFLCEVLLGCDGMESCLSRPLSFWGRLRSWVSMCVPLLRSGIS